MCLSARSTPSPMTCSTPGLSGVRTNEELRQVISHRLDRLARLPHGYTEEAREVMGIHRAVLSKILPTRSKQPEVVAPPSTATDRRSQAIIHCRRGEAMLHLRAQLANAEQPSSDKGMR